MAGRFAISDFLGLALIGGAAFGVFNEYQKSAQASTRITQSSQRPSPVPLPPQQTQVTQQPQVVVKENAHEFLSKLATKGDATAAKTVKSVESVHADSAAMKPLSIPTVASIPDEEFRFDVTREGLAATLQGMLEARRAIETRFIEDCRRTGRYPPDFADRCREMRADKEEVKRVLDALKRKERSGSWWWPF